MLRRLIYFALLLPMACIDPYQIEVPEGTQLLIVEGTITSGAGPHSVTLTRSATYGSDFQALIRPVTGATVVVRDNLGTTILLTESSDARGSYFTDQSFRAEIGRSYTLLIETPEGKLYSSLPETVESVPAIENIEIKTVILNQDGGEYPKSGIQLIAEVNDPADQNNFYYWRNGPAVYFLETSPELFIIRPEKIPAPKECCRFCYVTEISDNKSLFIAQDDNFNGLTTHIPAAFIADDGRRFTFNYRIDLKQYAISQDAYRFLRLVKQQAEISGSIFDPPPATIRGNMISLDYPDEVVLGYFIAAGETTKRVYVNKSDLTFRQNKATIPDDCRELPRSTIDPPRDWNP